MVIDHCITNSSDHGRRSMSLMAVIGMFIAVAIFLSLGLVILDSTVSDCSNLGRLQF